jgi:hypothetical protein
MGTQNSTEKFNIAKYEKSKNATYKYEHTNLIFKEKFTVYIFLS